MLTVEFNRFDLAPGSRILDIGCGNGRHTAAAYRMERVRVVGVDLAVADLRAARERIELHERLGEHGSGTWMLCAADGLRLPFGPERFDLVICSEVLEHVPDHRRAVAEIARVLKPGGHLAVSVPRFWPERVCWSLSPAYTRSPGGHIRIYRRRELIGLLAAGGFKPWAAHYAHGLHSPYWWLKCLLGPDRRDLRSVNLYHRFLTWDMLKKPRLTRWAERLLNPLLGKSLVVYLRKDAAGGSGQTALRSATMRTSAATVSMSLKASHPAAAELHHQVSPVFVGEAFSLDRRGWKAAPTEKDLTYLKDDS